MSSDDNRVGSSVQPCPSAPAPAEYLAPTPQEPTHRIEFHFAIQSGQPIHDPEGFELIHPSGAKEKGVLAGGKFERDGVPEGAYQMNFRYLKGCDWDTSSVMGEPIVGMNATTSGYPDGSEVTFVVYHRFHSESEEPLQRCTAKIKDGSASASFHYQQKLGEFPGGEFLFEARIGGKVICSDVLCIEAYPLETVQGVQQQLKRLGYYAGPIDGTQTGPTQAAVRAFQEDHPQLQNGGEIGPLMRRVLSAL